MNRLFNPHRDLGIQLLSLYLLMVIPVLAIIFAIDVLAGQRIQEEVRASDQSLARVIAKETDLTVRNALDAVEGLSIYPAAREGDKPGMGRIFAIAIATRPDVNLIYRLDSGGIMQYHFPIGPGSSVGTDFSSQDYFQGARKSSVPLISDGHISQIAEEPVATAVMPLHDEEGFFLGLVATDIRLESMSLTLGEILSVHTPQEEFQVIIVDHSGQIIADPQAARLLEPVTDIQPEVVQSALNGETGHKLGKNAAGDEFLYSLAPIPSARWAVIISRPTSVAFAQQITFHRITLLAFVAFTAIGLAFWLLLSRRVIVPVEQLASISQSIGANRGISPQERKQLESMSGRADQIGHLIRSLVRMEASIAARINEQAILLETSQAVVSSLDTRIVLNRILEQVERLMRVEKIAILALDEEMGVFRPRASRGLSTYYIEQMPNQPREPQSIILSALASGQPVQTGDTEADPTFAYLRERARAEGYRAMLAVPLQTQYTPPSALVVYHPEPHQFTAEEMQLLVNFANHATMAIENAALYARSDMRLQEQTRRLESLIQSMQDGLVLSDLGGNVLYANRRIHELADLADDLAGTPVSDVLARILAHSPEPQENHARVEAALKSAGQRSIEIQINYAGRNSTLRLQAFDVTDPKNVSLGQGLILKDITTDRELDRMKSGLIATVSHELRTPLAAIKGYATTLLADDVEWDPKSQREFLEIISRETNHLSELVTDLLDLSRIEAGSFKLQRAECNLEEIIQLAAARGHLQPGNQLEMQIEPDLPPLLADPPRLEAVLRNLIENSVKYAGDNAVIRVKVSRAEGNLVFRVEDNGPGIPAMQSQRVFESFYRLEDSFSHSGAGLGLSICQGFVRAHGGEIWVEPSQLGACIAFSIPIEDPKGFKNL